ncbi:hypothetical protein GCM10009535_54150 [Streptomyces thermocarboxydovorans]|uniref:Histidine kinase/HSP90-like ATPase domain-containing protein n=1 Tax=Streptomyces thermocarboxydovorans TaxID=59298 RepID=A0ABP3SYV3_9ACTN
MLADAPGPHDDASPGNGGDGECLLDYRFGLAELAKLRLLVEECGAGVGLTEPRRSDFLLAVNEIASNAIEHGGGGGRLLLWKVGDELECRIADSGPGFTEAVVPESLTGLDGATRGRGLYIARLVADRFNISAAAVGAVVTLAMRMQ